MTTNFKCLPVEVLFEVGYHDGPTSGVCEYNNEKLYFDIHEELYFKVPVIYEIDLFDTHRLRVFTLYRLPKKQMDILIYNNKIWDEYRFVDDGHEIFFDRKKDVGWTVESFRKDSCKWAIGYTTEDVWSIESYSISRRQRFC